MAFTDYETEQLRKALLKETRRCAVTLAMEAGYLGCSILCIENMCSGAEKDMILIDKDLCRVV